MKKKVTVTTPYAARRRPEMDVKDMMACVHLAAGAEPPGRFMYPAHIVFTAAGGARLGQSPA